MPKPVAEMTNSFRVQVRRRQAGLQEQAVLLQRDDPMPCVGEAIEVPCQDGAVQAVIRSIASPSSTSRSLVYSITADEIGSPEGAAAATAAGGGKAPASGSPGADRSGEAPGRRQVPTEPRSLAAGADAIIDNIAGIPKAMAFARAHFANEVESADDSAQAATPGRTLGWVPLAFGCLMAAVILIAALEEVWDLLFDAA